MALNARSVQPDAGPVTDRAIDALEASGKLAAALERIKDANFRVTVEHVFFGAFAHGLKVSLSYKVPTAGTNGKRVIFNPDFVASLNKGQLYGLVLHEIAHVALGHQLRRGERDRMGWNVACDYSINQILTDSGVHLPERALLNPKFAGWSAEQIYQFLQRKGGPTPEEIEMAGIGQVDDQPTQEGLEKKKAKAEGKGKGKSKAGKAEGKGKGDEGEAAEGGDGEAEDDAPEGKGEAGGGNGKPGAAKDQDSEGGGGSGSDDSDDSNDDEADGDNDDDFGADDEDEDEDAGTYPEDDEDADDPYADDWKDDEDDVLREDGSLPTLTDARTEWTVRTTQAELLARGAGKMPGSLEQELAESKRSASPWVALLADALTEVSNKDYSYAKLNRYYGQSGCLMPGLHSEDVGPLVIGVDTSGSTFDGPTMARVAGELEQILAAFEFPEIHLVSWDTHVTDVQVLGPGDNLEFSPKGGGGTDVNAFFNYIEDEGLTPRAVICLTDLDFWRYPSTEPGFKVIWGAVKSNHSLMSRAPFGQVINIEDYTKEY